MGVQHLPQQGTLLTAVPMLRLPEMTAVQEEESQVSTAGTDKIPVTGRTAAALAEFQDFWDDGSEPQSGGVLSSKTAEGICMDTPRKGQDPLKLFKLGTPRPAPSTPPKEIEKTSFVPPWPYSAQWPFNRAPTTLELRRLPKECTLEVVTSQLESWGFSGKYDFISMPIGGCNSDAVIINTVRHADGRALAGCLHGFNDWEGLPKGVDCKTRPCRVSWSFAYQGFDALVCAYTQNSETGYYDHEGNYTGPWVYQGNIWQPLFSLVPMWPVAEEWLVEEQWVGAY